MFNHLKNTRLRNFFLVFILVFIAFVSTTYRDYKIDMNTGMYRRLMTAGDVIPNTFLPYVVLQEGEIYFDSIFKTIQLFDGNKERPYFIIPFEGHKYSAYPILSGLMALPVYFLPIVLQKVPEVTYHENILKILVLGRLTASLYAALSVAIAYDLFNKITENKKTRLVQLFIVFYAFGTNTYSITSRGMWQHTTSQFLFSILLWLLFAYKPKTEHLRWLLIGVTLGAATAARPTNGIFAIMIGLYVLFKKRNFIKQYVLGGTPWVLFMLAYNHIVYGSALTEGYGARNDFDWSTPLATSLPAYFVSPARGFLFISPPLLLGFFMMYKIYRDEKYLSERNTAYRYLSVAVIISIITFAKWYTWDGAPGFGSRMLSDYLPFFALFSFEVFRKLPKWGIKVVAVLIVYSVLLHFNAVYFRKSRCSDDHNWSFYCLKPPTEPAKY